MTAPAGRPAAAPGTAADGRYTKFVARQPIFDRERRLVGYELLYRAHGTATSAGNADMARMSGATLVNGVLDIGLDRLTGPVPAWINVPRDLLLDGTLEVLDPRRVVLELLETITPDEETLTACSNLRTRGYTLALDDFDGGPEYEPLVRLAHIVKLDVLGVTPEALRPRVERLRASKVRLLAERIEDQATFLACCGLGFEYFQGYHFRRPEVVSRRALPVGLVRVAKLMALVGDPCVSDQTIEDELRSDPGMSVKLLRIVNNASTGHREVTSLLHAIQLAGRRALHQWLALLLVSSAPVTNDVDREAILCSLERGRFCELLALGAGHREQADPLFLAGLLSRLDEILGVPMDTLVQDVGVGGDVAAALRGEPGSYTRYLDLATAYADGDFERATDAAIPLGVTEELAGLHGEAAGWARQVLSGR